MLNWYHVLLKSRGCLRVSRVHHGAGMFHDHVSVCSIVSTTVENTGKARIYVLKNIYI